MTVALTTDYNDSRDDIIKDALILLGIIGADDSLPANDATLAARFLNRIVKHWEASGAHVWTEEEATIWLTNGQHEYSLGKESTDDHWAIDYVETDTTVLAVSGATALTVTSTSGMTVGDYIGVVLDDGIVHWTTIATIPGTTSLTLTLATTDDVSIGNYVYTYTSKPARPLRIHSISRRSNIRHEESEVCINKISISDYHEITNKKSEGIPTQWLYIPKLVSGVLKLWQVPNDVSYRLNIQYTRPLFDFDSSVNTSDIPQEWLKCLVYRLAADLAPAYGKTDIAALLEQKADALFMSVNSYDQEDSQVFISPTNEDY